MAELRRSADAGGRTVVDPTCRGIGRDPAALARISEATGLQGRHGLGLLSRELAPEVVKTMSVDAIADEIVGRGAAAHAPACAIGLIGEIGVSKDFTAEEEKSLRGAAQGAGAHRAAADGPPAGLVAARA